MSHFIWEDSVRISNSSKVLRKRGLRYLLGTVDYLCWPSKALFALQQLVQIRPSWASWITKAAVLCPPLLSKSISCPGMETSSCPNSSPMNTRVDTALYMLYQESLSSCLQPLACAQPLGLQDNRAGQGNAQAVPAARMLRAHPSQSCQSDSSPISATLSFSCDSPVLSE